MKKGVLILTLSALFFLPLISAQFGFGYGFSISGLIESFLNSSNSTYILFFLLLFTIFTLVLSRMSFFRDRYGNPNAFSAGIVSFCISAIAIYYLYQNGFRGEGLFSWLGLSENALSILVLILVALAAILIIWKLGFKGLFLFGGLALILTALFTEIIYERGIAMFLGFVFLVIGLFWWNRTRSYVGGAGRWLGRQAIAGARRRPMWAVSIGGIILSVIGLFIHPIVFLVGILITGIGFFGRRVYSETRFAQGRDMSPRRAEAEAYREEAYRRSQVQNRAHEEAIRLQRQIEQIQSQLQLVENDLTSYRNALAGARTPEEAVNIRNGIMVLENQRRELLNALRQLTHG